MFSIGLGASAASVEFFMGLVVFSALLYGVDVMSGLIRNVMEFETRMDLFLKAEISVLLSLMQDVS